MACSVAFELRVRDHDGDTTGSINGAALQVEVPAPGHAAKIWDSSFVRKFSGWHEK